MTLEGQAHEQPGIYWAHSTRETLLVELGSRLEPGVLLTDEELLVSYETDVLSRKGQAAFVARPRNTQEVREVLRWAYSYRVPLVVQGANTGPVLGSTPDGSGLQGVLSTRAMTETLEVDPDNATVKASAGVTLAALQEALLPHGLSFPIDLGANPTIGGMLAANTGGSRLVRYGDVRKRVLGLEVVLPNQEADVIDLMAALRKDNHGPDLKQLFISSAGLLGVVTTAVLDLAPLPQGKATAYLALEGETHALECLRRLRRESPEWLSAFELLSGPALDALFRHKPSRLAWPFPVGAPPRMAALVELSGSASDEELSSKLAQLIAACVSAGEALDGWLGDPEAFWALRHLAIEAISKEGTLQPFDVSVEISRLPELCQRARAEVHRADPSAKCVDFGHFADGGVHLIVVRDQEPSEQQASAVAEAVYGLVRSMGGAFSAEHNIGRENEKAWASFCSPAYLSLLAAIKKVCDPREILGAIKVPAL
jgi:FAD/FMN-containing dehydrogenase